MSNNQEKFTLINYPLNSFTRQQLLDFQGKGVWFASNNWKGDDEFYQLVLKFDSFDEIDYRVDLEQTNIALFEELAGITPKKTPRKHAELIKVWAEDETVVIQYLSHSSRDWIDVVGNKPLWSENTEYRIKPVKFISEQTRKDIQQGLTAGIATCLGMLILKEEI